jgi:endonuclease/exonuclease/phosphatase family metal-dependent hydrolase
MISKLTVFLAFILTTALTVGGGEYVQLKQYSAKSICVISYNIRMNTPSDGINAWPNRKEKVIALLKFYQPDVFGVQEALPEQVKDLAAGLPEFDMVGVGRDDGKSEGEHMMIFFRKDRFEKIDDGTFWLNEDTGKPGFGWDAACNRTCTWINLKDLHSGKDFFLFNTHFDHRGTLARAESAKLIIRKMKDINKNNIPFVLTGDFNAIRESEPIHTILDELKDSREISETASYGPTFSSGGFEVKEGTRIIDYIFVNERVNVLRHAIISDSFGMYYPSDHLPVFAEIEFR